MLQALLQDLAQLPDVTTWVCRDARLSPPLHGANVHVLPVPEGSDIHALLDGWIHSCDAVWPIAPETGGALQDICRRVHDAGKLLLTSPAEAVWICGDKLRTFELLQRHAIPAVSSLPLPDILPSSSARWVVKAKDGAGCADSYIVETAEDYRAIKSTLNPIANFILQPFIPGKAVSLSCLFKHGRASLLSYNKQKIVVRGRHFELQGCIVNAPCIDWERYRQLVGHVAQALPELWGYAGLDLLETPDGPLVLEINPRLTTSYVGLRQALQKNIAQRVLSLLHDDLPPSVHYGQPVTVTV